MPLFLPSVGVRVLFFGYGLIWETGLRSRSGLFLFFKGAGGVGWVALHIANACLFPYIELDLEV